MQTEVTILDIVHPQESIFHPEAKVSLLQNRVNYIIFQVLFYGFNLSSNNDSLSILFVPGTVLGAGGKCTVCHTMIRAKDKNQTKQKKEKV